MRANFYQNCVGKKFFEKKGCENDIFVPIQVREKKETLFHKKSVFKSYDELPLFLNAETVAKLLGISPSSKYELMHEKGFPVLKIGYQLVVPKEKFRTWVEQNTGGNGQYAEKCGVQNRARFRAK